MFTTKKIAALVQNVVLSQMVTKHLTNCCLINAYRNVLCVLYMDFNKNINNWKIILSIFICRTDKKSLDHLMCH